MFSQRYHQRRLARTSCHHIAHHDDRYVDAFSFKKTNPVKASMQA